MFLTSLNHIFRHLWKTKATTSINIMGFAFSLSICFIIGIYVLNEFSYDKFHKNYNNIYRVVNEENQRSQVDYTIKDEILKGIPEVNNYCHLLLRANKIPLEYQNKIIDINYYPFADNNFFQIFSFPLTIGNPKAPFDKDIHSVLISERIAKLLFEKENPIGKRVKAFNKEEYTVCGIFKDFPVNSSIYADIVRNETYEINKQNERTCNDKGECEYQRTVFVTINDPSRVEQVTRKINDQLKGKDKFLKKVRLQPFKEMYLFDNTKDFNFNEGNLSLIRLFVGIAFITLILACINYINLSIAQYNQRTRETGVRKTLGADRFRLIRSFLGESTVVTTIALIVAIIFTYIFLPFFKSMMDLRLQLSDLITVRHLLVSGILIFVFGIINGIWPALLITSYNPGQIFQKRLVKIQGKNHLRNTLITMQFAASIVLIICVLLIVKQLYFIKHKDLGFKDSHLLKITTYHISNFEPLKIKLLQNPSIINATYSSGIPGIINYGMNAGKDAEFYTEGVPVIHGDASFIKTLEIQLMKGRDFVESENKKACLINETAATSFNWEKDWVDKYFQKGDTTNGYKVVGVFKDFHYKSMYKEIGPLVIEFDDKQKSFLTLRISGKDMASTMNYINKTWNEIEPDVPIDYAFYDAWFDSMYKKEEQLAKMVTTFAVIAIIISCLGIFSQAILNSLNRIKEIGIRKINGAKEREVIALLNRDFIKWVVIAFLIACPIAWYVMHKWLENFAYKTELSWWVFGAAGVIALLIAQLTVSWQSWRAATRNPVESLRYE